MYLTNIPVIGSNSQISLLAGGSAAVFTGNTILIPPLIATFVSQVDGIYVSESPVFTAGDSLPQFAALLSQPTGPVNLSTAVSADLALRERESGNILVFPNITITDQTIEGSVGVVNYDWGASDLNVAGNYDWTVTVFFQNGRVTFRSALDGAIVVANTLIN